MPRSKVRKTEYTLLWEGAPFSVDFEAVITKDGSEFKLESFWCHFSESEKLLRALYKVLPDKANIAFTAGIRTLLADDLQPQLYSLYYNGELID